MPHVFIGYSRKDSKDAAAIQAYLTDAGISCFLDTTDIRDYAKWIRGVPAACIFNSARSRERSTSLFGGPARMKQWKRSRFS